MWNVWFDAYRENRTKHFHGLSPDGSLLTYTQTKLFHFDSNKSGDGLQEADTICTINLPLVVSLTDHIHPLLCILSQAFVQ